MGQARDLLLACCALALALPASRAPAETAPRVGQPAPDAELTLIDGSKIRLSDLKGQVVVLNFWATWCVPCRTELPTLDTFYRLRRAAGLRVFAVTTQDSLPNYQLKPLFAKMAIPAVRRLKGPFGVIGGVPTNYVIGRDGTVRYAAAAALDLERLNAILVPLLNEQP